MNGGRGNQAGLSHAGARPQSFRIVYAAEVAFTRNRSSVKAAGRMEHNAAPALLWDLPQVLVHLRLCGHRLAHVQGVQPLCKQALNQAVLSRRCLRRCDNYQAHRKTLLRGGCSPAGLRRMSPNVTPSGKAQPAAILTAARKKSHTAKSLSEELPVGSLCCTPGVSVAAAHSVLRKELHPVMADKCPLVGGTPVLSFQLRRKVLPSLVKLW